MAGFITFIIVFALTFDVLLCHPHTQYTRNLSQTEDENKELNKNTIGYHIKIFRNALREASGLIRDLQSLKESFGSSISPIIHTVATIIQSPHVPD